MLIKKKRFGFDGYLVIRSLNLCIPKNNIIFNEADKIVVRCICSDEFELLESKYQKPGDYTYKKDELVFDGKLSDENKIISFYNMVVKDVVGTSTSTGYKYIALTFEKMSTFYLC